MGVAVDQESPLCSELSKPISVEPKCQPVSKMAWESSHAGTWRCGRIVTENGRLLGVYGRWWPHLGSWLQVIWDTNFRSMRGDRCELFYHEPLSTPGYLCLSYVHSGARTTLATCYLAKLALEEIARIRAAKAIVCHVTNYRVTDRLMQRWGWEAHCSNLSGRHFIKRFYGSYPEIPPYWRERLNIDNDRTRHETRSEVS